MGACNTYPQQIFSWRNKKNTETFFIGGGVGGGGGGKQLTWSYVKALSIVC